MASTILMAKAETMRPRLAKRLTLSHATSALSDVGLGTLLTTRHFVYKRYDAEAKILVYAGEAVNANMNTCLLPDFTDNAILEGLVDHAPGA
jgi:hypothetical protein